MSDHLAQRLFETPQEHGPTRAREALIAEALMDCGQLLDTTQRALLEAQQIAQVIQEAAAHLTQERTRLEETFGRYGQAIRFLDKGSRERFTATVVEQTRVALEQARAELRRASEQEQRELGHAAVAAVNAALRTQAAAPAPMARPSLFKRYLDWIASPWGHRATLFVSVLAALLVYNTGLFSRA